MIYLLIPLVMSFLARMSGSDWWSKKIWSRLPELLFALVIASVSLSIWGSWILFFIAWVSSYFAMEAGHGTFYGMDGWRSEDPKRKQKLEYIVQPIYELFGGNKYNPKYSWACMGLKGFLIALPLGLWAIPMAILWPTAYYIGNRLEGNNCVSEYLSGAFIGTIILLAL